MNMNGHPSTMTTLPAGGPGNSYAAGATLGVAVPVLVKRESTTEENAGPFAIAPSLAKRLVAGKEAVWIRIGSLRMAMGERDGALTAYETVLRYNPDNITAMTQVGAILAKQEQYARAIHYLQQAISADSNCGEAWAVLAHCYVMTDELHRAYQAYQSALAHLPDPKDPNLWYGIGLLYDRYGSLDHALEAFLAVLNISPDFERADEVCFCIGIIYKEQQEFDRALEFFNRVVIAEAPPPPLTRADAWYQIGHVNELKKDVSRAIVTYRKALEENPRHPKTLQQLGWLQHQQGNSEEALRLLRASVESDGQDGQSWYLLGRVHTALREFRQAYDAYQQAVYRDSRNPTFWCSIGVLYYQMTQYRDAMDAYSRAIRLNPYVSEVWYDLGTLYESCNQMQDAIDAYKRASELSPENQQIRQRLIILQNGLSEKQGIQQAVGGPPVPMLPDSPSRTIAIQSDHGILPQAGQANQPTMPGVPGATPISLATGPIATDQRFVASRPQEQGPSNNQSRVNLHALIRGVDQRQTDLSSSQPMSMPIQYSQQATPLNPELTIQGIPQAQGGYDPQAPIDGHPSAVGAYQSISGPQVQAFAPDRNIDVIRGSYDQAHEQNSQLHGEMRQPEPFDMTGRIGSSHFPTSSTELIHTHEPRLPRFTSGSGVSIISGPDPNTGVSNGVEVTGGFGGNQDGPLPAMVTGSHMPLIHSSAMGSTTGQAQLSALGRSSSLNGSSHAGLQSIIHSDSLHVDFKSEPQGNWGFGEEADRRGAHLGTPNHSNDSSGREGDREASVDDEDVKKRDRPEYMTAHEPGPKRHMISSVTNMENVSMEGDHTSRPELSSAPPFPFSSLASGPSASIAVTATAAAASVSNISLMGSRTAGPASSVVASHDSPFGSTLLIPVLQKDHDKGTRSNGVESRPSPATVSEGEETEDEDEDHDEGNGSGSTGEAGDRKFDMQTSHLVALAEASSAAAVEGQTSAQINGITPHGPSEVSNLMDRGAVDGDHGDRRMSNVQSLMYRGLDDRSSDTKALFNRPDAKQEAHPISTGDNGSGRDIPHGEPPQPNHEPMASDGEPHQIPDQAMSAIIQSAEDTRGGGGMDQDDERSSGDPSHVTSGDAGDSAPRGEGRNESSERGDPEDGEITD